MVGRPPTYSSLRWLKMGARHANKTRKLRTTCLFSVVFGLESGSNTTSPESRTAQNRRKTRSAQGVDQTSSLTADMTAWHQSISLWAVSLAVQPTALKRYRTSASRRDEIHAAERSIRPYPGARLFTQDTRSLDRLGQCIDTCWRNLLVRTLCEKGLRVRDFDDFAVIHEDNAVGHRAGKAHFVGHAEHHGMGNF